MYTISEEQINAILRYLGEKPYKEVAQIIAMLTKLPKYEERQESINKKA